MKFSGNNSMVVEVAWSPDGTKIASTGAHATVEVWDEDVQVWEA